MNERWRKLDVEADLANLSAMGRVIKMPEFLADQIIFDHTLAQKASEMVEKIQQGKQMDEVDETIWEIVNMLGGIQAANNAALRGKQE